MISWYTIATYTYHEYDFAFESINDRGNLEFYLLQTRAKKIDIP